MWSRTFSITTKEVTRQQMWKLFANVNSWNTWDSGIKYALLEGRFEQGSNILLKPQKGPRIRIILSKVVENNSFVTVSSFPMAKIYHEHLLEETPDGLRISYTITVKGALSFLWVKLVAQQLIASISKDIENQISIAKVL